MRRGKCLWGVKARWGVAKTLPGRPISNTTHTPMFNFHPTPAAFGGIVDSRHLPVGTPLLTTDCLPCFWA